MANKLYQSVHTKNYTGVLYTKNLNFSFGKMPVLSDISVHFNRGTFTSIIGPNGSGKTTLLRNLTRWLTPQYKTVYLENRDLRSFSLKKLARKLAFVKQYNRIDFEFSVFDVVTMGRAPHLKRFQNEDKHDYEIIREALELTHTDYLKERPITNLSGGELQRVIIARALAQQSQFLLLDEPISHLDLHHQIEILSVLKRLEQHKKITVIAVLHDLNRAAQFSDSIVLLNKGKIFAQGNPQVVLTRENIKNVYGIDVLLQKHPVNNLPVIIPLIN